MELQLPTRPVRPDDEPRLYRLWPRLSRETVYRRFHAPLRGLPAEAVRRLVTVDHDLREAVVAVVGDEVVGVARYDRDPTDPARAEFAVVVEDAWQGAGVGRQLLAELTDLGARRGVRLLAATVQADNDRMLAIIAPLLPGAVLVPDHDVYDVVAGVPAPVSAAAAAPSPVPSTPHPAPRP